MSEKLQGWLDGNYRGEPVDGDPAKCFVQWKGTDVCLDFRCPCGYDGHLDGYFAYALQCKRCGAVYEMPANIYPRRIEPNPHVASPLVPDRGGEFPLRGDAPEHDEE